MGQLETGNEIRKGNSFITKNTNPSALTLIDSTIKIYLNSTWLKALLYFFSFDRTHFHIGRRGGYRTLDLFRVKEALSH